MASFYTKTWKFGRFDFLEEIGLYQEHEISYVNLEDEDGHQYHYDLLPGFRTDGGSVPKAFQWLIKGWYPDASWKSCLTNLAFAIHDANYGCTYVSRKIADDMLRSMLRDAGWNRFTASTVCWAVNTFACLHYGDDDLENRDFIRFHT